jgi:hypothetical protein
MIIEKITRLNEDKERNGFFLRMGLSGFPIWRYMIRTAVD